MTVCVHGFWLLFMVGTLLALGLSGFSLFCHWVWLLSTLFAGATFAGYWVAQQLEAWHKAGYGAGTCGIHIRM